MLAVQESTANSAADLLVKRDLVVVQIAGDVAGNAALIADVQTNKLVAAGLVRAAAAAGLPIRGTNTIIDKMG